jgi:hypothetical protein
VPIRSSLCLVAALLSLLSPLAAAHDPSAYGGVFRSRDFGRTWFPIDAGQFISAATCLAVAPADSNHILYGTDSRLLRSRNGGRDWKPESANQLRGPIHAVAFDSSGKSAVVSTSVGIFHTRDGANWLPATAPVNASPARAIAAGTRRIFLASSSGIFFSEDHGQTWSAGGPSLPQGKLTALVVSESGSERLFSLIGGNVFHSSDGAKTWQPRSVGLPAAKVEALAIDHDSAPRLWAAAANRMFKSEDAGVTWEPYGQPLSQQDVSVRGIAVRKGMQTLLVTTHRGVLRSDDGARNWTAMEGNLPVHLEAGPLVGDPLEPATLYAGFALLPYLELWRRAEEGGSLLTRIDPWSLAGGAAFLVLMVIGGTFAVRWLRSGFGPPLTLEPPEDGKPS